ncbi:diguanylate cyclase [Yokenella regensburgei]|jgi:diguanylate cyclase|uniref:Diguanylate cyclase DosC n=2 Tax=Yokenella regensburgei TaxID=158877 RepID=A0ABX9S2Q6_9ENTR|nr:diguanylate cyclase domain protein [Yokenella regensburgei ATCC 43003]RKR65112.1 diguanylate cyclase [Yokenella regensburgei]VFS15591.1 Diguanylate cyclase DosC [Yokenella regensburgei]
MMQSYVARVREEWLELLRDTDSDVQASAKALADAHARALSEVFYQRMLADPQAEEFLSNDQVETRLKKSLALWIQRVLACKADEVDALIALQQHVGEIHARIGIPIQLVDMGARVIKKNLIPIIIAEGGREDEKMKLLSFTLCSIDLAMEIMSRTFTFGESSSLKDDENYRIFSLLENAEEEKERQIGSLLSWEMDVMYKVMLDSELGSTPPISRADFGMWFTHKGRHYFSGIAEVGYIAKLIQETDELFSRFRDPSRTAKQKHQRTELLLQMKSNTAQINTLLRGLFDDVAKHEVGMDVLTKLLNRRFLAAIFKREIAHANRSGTPLSVLLIDVDKFKEINDGYGHAAGDEILRKISQVFYDNVRSSDFVFRYGGDEFLIVLTEANQTETLRIAERIRSKASRQSITTPDGKLLATTLSIGAAMFDGHPDYERLVQSADAALYRSKRQGRNRIEMYILGDTPYS